MRRWMWAAVVLLSSSLALAQVEKDERPGEAASAPALETPAAEAAVEQAPPAPPPLTEAPLPPVEPAPAQPPPAAGVSRIELKDGQVLHGRVVFRDERRLVVELPAGGRLEVPASSVRVVTEEKNVRLTDEGEVWFQDPNRTRYFYGPSAMMLQQGELTFSQKELLFSSLGYGVTDWLSVQVGAVVPAWLLGAQGLNLIAAVKVGGPLGDSGFHLAGGAQGLLLPGLGFGGTPTPVAAGFLFGTGSYGNSDAHVSVSAGVPFLFAGGQGNQSALGEALVTVAGNIRVGKHAALVSETWVMPFFQQGDVFIASGNGVRILGEKFAVDLAGVWLGSARNGLLSYAPVPWVDFTYNF